MATALDSLRLDPDLALQKPDTALPPAPPAAPNAGGLDPRVLAYFADKMQMPEGLDRAGLQAAQAADLARERDMRLAQAGERATAMMQRRPADFTGLTNDQVNVRNWAAQRQLAGEDMERAIRLGMMPLTIRKTMAETDKAEAEGPKLRAETAATTAGIPKTQAEARKATAEAHASELENGPPPPAMVQIAERFKVPVDPQTTTKQLRETIDAEAKRQGQQIDWGKLGLEGERVKLEGKKLDWELEKYGSAHPYEPVPGFRYTGVGAPLDRDSEPVRGLADKVAAAQQAKAALKEMLDIYDRNGPAGRVMGADAQKLDTLHEKLTGAIGRATAGGRLSAYDVPLASGQLGPKAHGVQGAFRPDLVHAAISTLMEQADRDPAIFARAHNMVPLAEAARAKNDWLIQQGIKDPEARKAMLREMGF